MPDAFLPERQHSSGLVTKDYDERWLEVWRRRCRGETYVDIGKALGITRQTAMAYYDRACALEQARQTNPDAERAFLQGRAELMLERSLEAFESCSDQRARPEHMTNAIRALQMVARLGGYDIARKQSIHVSKGETEVTIKVGGEEMVRRRVVRDPEVLNGQAVEVASRALVGLGNGPGDEVAP